jgi:hypothetical protein
LKNLLEELEEETTMGELCALCRSGARGEVGHPALREEFRSGVAEDGAASYVLYSCVICGGRWGRGRTQGRFAWAAKSAGAPVY